jgi:hypothetical protein
MVDGVDRAGRCRRRSAAADQVRGVQSTSSGLKPIVAINKVDRPDARANVVAGEVFDLFAALDATDEQLDFPMLYGSAKEGWMAPSLEGPKDSMTPLFELVAEARAAAERSTSRANSRCWPPFSKRIPIWAAFSPAASRPAP